MSAQSVDPIVDDDPKVVSARHVEPPASGVHPSTPPEEKRDTLYDPDCGPPHPWPRRILDFVLGILAFFSRAMRGARERLAARLDPPPLALSLPPPPLHYKGEIPPEQFGELLLHNVFRLSPAYLLAAEDVIRQARHIKHFPDRERRLVFVHFAITRLSGARRELVPIAWVRTRLYDVGRSDMNRALEQLEKEKTIKLHRIETNDRREVALAISDPVRGCLTHIELRDPL